MGNVVHSGSTLNNNKNFDEKKGSEPFEQDGVRAETVPNSSQIAGAGVSVTYKPD
jgi:hypothetical protein